MDQATSATETLREGRARYFETWGFDESSYVTNWVELEPIAGIPLGFPNTRERKRAVKFHDLHHVLTGYDANWAGEGEISAWELAAGCHGHFAAWIINLLVLQYAVPLYPRRVLHAVARGRRARSLYTARELDEALLEEPIADVKRRLDIADAVPAIGVGDVLHTAGLWLASTSIVLMPFLVLPWLVRSFIR